MWLENSSALRTCTGSKPHVSWQRALAAKEANSIPSYIYRKNSQDIMGSGYCPLLGTCYIALCWRQETVKVAGA